MTSTFVCDFCGKVGYMNKSLEWYGVTNLPNGGAADMCSECFDGAKERGQGLK